MKARKDLSVFTDVFSVHIKSSPSQSTSAESLRATFRVGTESLRSQLSLWAWASEGIHSIITEKKSEDFSNAARLFAHLFTQSFRRLIPPPISVTGVLHELVVVHPTRDHNFERESAFSNDGSGEMMDPNDKGYKIDDFSDRKNSKLPYWRFGWVSCG